jgi:hypothetical protein
MRFKHLLLALLLFLGVSQAIALELGEITALSRLGQPFKAEVQLLERSGEARLAAQCFKVNQDGNANTGLFSLAAGRVVLTRNDDTSRLLIASDQLINEPVVHLNVRVVCGPFQYRSYTLLMDPPASRLAAPASRLASQAPQGSKQGSKNVNRAGVEELAQHSAVNPTVAGPEWQCAEGESAHSIAASIFPNNSTAQSRFLSALLNANPDRALGARGEKRLAAGTVLRLPETRHLPTEKAVKIADTQIPKASASLASPLIPSAPLPAKIASATSADSLSVPPVVEAQSLSEQIQALEASLSASARATKSVDPSATVPLSPTELPASPPTPQEQLPQPPPSPLSQSVPPVAIKPAVTPQVPSVPITKTEYDYGITGFLLEIFSGWETESLALLGLLVLLLLWKLTRSRRTRRVLTNKPINDDSINSVRRDPISIIEEDARSAAKTAQVRHETSVALLGTKEEGKEEKLEPEQAVVPQAIKEDHEFNPVMELAEIMLSFGRVKGAAQALQEYIEKSPDEALQPWMKLLEVYRQGDMREEFAGVSEKLKLHFNVAPADWDSMADCASRPVTPIDEETASIEQLLNHLPNIARMSRIRDEITRTWDSPEGFEYLNSLLRDNRAGERQGFPLATVSELLYLMDILEKRLSHTPS